VGKFVWEFLFLCLYLQISSIFFKFYNFFLNKFGEYSEPKGIRLKFRGFRVTLQVVPGKAELAEKWKRGQVASPQRGNPVARSVKHEQLVQQAVWWRMFSFIAAEKEA
jgi:hypothetical protein